MWLSRYWLMIPVLAIAGSLAAKRATAVTAGTLPTPRPAVHHHAGRRRIDGGRADFPAGARARAHRRASPDDGRRLTAMKEARKPMVTRPIVMAAIRDSFRKLDPRVQFRNPVMFVVLVGSLLTTVIGIAAAAGAMPEAGRPAFILAVAAWLWLTVLFANFRRSGGRRPRQGAGGSAALHAPARACEAARRHAGRPSRSRELSHRGSERAAPGRRRPGPGQRDHRGRRRSHRGRRLGQ